MAMQPLIPSSLAMIAPSAGPTVHQDSTAKIARCATEFESLLLTQMLRSAREAGGGGLTGDGDDDAEANSTLLEVGEQQFAQALASNGGLGIAKMVITGLTNHANR
jgi:Rod binding domain-containing protein